MPKKHDSMLYDCDRCAFTFKKKQLKRQRGMYLCVDCFDTTLEIAPINVRWDSPRDNATSLAPETTPVVYEVTNAATLVPANSQVRDREGSSSELYMKVVGTSGNVWVTDIGAQPVGTVLTLEGTSDSAIVFLTPSVTLDVSDSGAGLGKGSTVQLVRSATGVWVETSRNLTVPYRGA